MVTGRIDDPYRHTRAEDSAFRHTDFYLFHLSKCTPVRVLKIHIMSRNL